MNPIYNDIRDNNKFVITSIWSAQKSVGRVFFHCYSKEYICSVICYSKEYIYFRKTYVLCILESPRRGDSNKYTKRMIHKKDCSTVSVIHASDGTTSSIFITANSI